jgi:hypothetical protein
MQCRETILCRLQNNKIMLDGWRFGVGDGDEDEDGLDG